MSTDGVFFRGLLGELLGDLHASSVVCLGFPGEAATVAARVARDVVDLFIPCVLVLFAGACGGNVIGGTSNRSNVSITSSVGLSSLVRSSGGFEGRVCARCISPRLLFVTLDGNSGSGESDFSLMGRSGLVSFVLTGEDERRLTTASLVLVAG